MTKPTLSSGRSKDILKHLMNPAESESANWSSEDLRAILAHLLNTRVAAQGEAFSALEDWTSEGVESALKASAGLTFGDLLEQETVPAETIRLVKDYAKHSMTAEEELPREVARVLYVSAILRGQLNGFADISNLDDGSVLRETRRCLTFHWIPENVRKLMGNGLKQSQS